MLKQKREVLLILEYKHLRDLENLEKWLARKGFRVVSKLNSGRKTSLTVEKTLKL